MKIDSRPTPPKAVEPPKPQAAPPPPPEPAPAARTAPRDGYVSGQNASRQQQALRDPDATSLRTEQLGDGSANCLEQAMGLAGPEDSVVLLEDSQDGVGHALVHREDGSVVDPNQPTASYQSVGQWQAMHPGYTDPHEVPASDMRQVLSTPPGPQRDALIHGMGLGEASRRMVADGPTPSTSGSVTVGSNGQVTFTAQTQLENPEVEFERGRISGKGSSGPLAETEVSLSWNPAERRPDGTYEVTLSHSAQVGAQAEGEGSLGPYGVAGGLQAGVSASQEYQLNLTEDQLWQVGTGAYPLPSLSDPLSLPEGGSLTMSTGAFQNSSGSINYGPLTLSSESSRTQDYSLALERTGDSTVRVTVGPSETVQHRMELGLSFGDVANAHLIGRDRAVTDSTTASVEFDLSQPQGQQAYENFLRTGQLPTQEGPGIPDTYQEQTVGYEGALGAGLSLGNVLNLEHQFWSEDLTYTTRVDNGVTSITANGHTSEGNSFAVDITPNPDGTQTLNSVGLEVQEPGRLPEPLRISLTGPEGVRSMQEAAFRQAQHGIYESLRRFEPALQGASNDQVQEWIRANHAPDSRLHRLTAEPGDAGFSYSDWLGTYQEQGDAPFMPSLTQSLLGLQEPLDLRMAEELFSGLNGYGDSNSLLSPHGVGYDIPSYFELGVQSMPGVKVEGLPF